MRKNNNSFNSFQLLLLTSIPRKSHSFIKKINPPDFPIELLSVQNSLKKCIHAAEQGNYNLLLAHIENNEIDTIGNFTSQYPEIPVILICENADPDTIHRAMQQGVNDLIPYSEIAISLNRTLAFALSRQIKKAGLKRGDKSIFLSERKYKQIADNSRDLICILSPGLIFTYISPSVKEILGYEIEELLDKCPFQFFYPEDIEKMPGSSIQNNKGEEKYHYRLKHKDGKLIWFETFIKPIAGINGEIQLLATSKNITKRKKSAILMDEVQQLTKVGGWEYDIEKKQVYATKEIANLFNIPESSKMSFRKALSLFTTSSQIIIKREIKQALNYGKSWDLELSFANDKGQVSWVRTLGRPYSKNGKVHKIGGTLQDISERIKYEDLLHSKQIELKSFVENTPAAIAMFDRQMNYIAASYRWHQDYKLKGKRTTGKNHYTLFPNTPNNWKIIFEKCLNGAVETCEEFKTITKKGTIKWFRWEVRPWRDLEENIGGIIVFTEQITHRKLAEEAAQAQQKRMREIYEITSDISGNLEDRIKRIIEKATISLGMECSILAKVEENTCRIIEAFKTGGIYEPGYIYDLDSSYCAIAYKEDNIMAINHIGQSNYNTHPSYSDRKLEAYIAVPIYARGLKYGILTFQSARPVENFTQADKDFVQVIGQWIGGAIDKKKYQKELVLAKEKAEEGSRAKAHFLSTMSHEIRTPMNAVVGLTHLLLEGSPKPEQVRNLKTLQFSANNLLALINDILDFSKIESGKIEIENIGFSLKDLMEGLHNIFELKAQEKQVILNFELPDEIPERIKGDPVRLNQILSNLLSNAVKFTDKGGVTLSVEKIGDSSNAIDLSFSVADTGIGIPEEKLEIIFDSFTQASSDTTRKFGGTGLGLAISKRLTKMQHGEITVESKMGVGTIFRVDLPFQKITSMAQDMIPPISPVELEDLEGLNVLLVEDNEVNQLVAIQFLKKKLMQVDTAENGSDALEKIKSKNFDIVLMDLQMPGMDGFETTKQIRSMEGDYYKNVPVIALTAATKNEISPQLIAAGINDFISKPFVPADFYFIIYQHTAKVHVKLSKTDRKVTDNYCQPRFEKLMDIAFGEKDFYLNMLTKMREEIISFNDNFAESIAKRDIEKLGFIKHKLTSSLVILNLGDLLKDIEMVRNILKNKSAMKNLEEYKERISVHCQQVVEEINIELERSALPQFR